MSEFNTSFDAHPTKASHNWPSGQQSLRSTSSLGVLFEGQRLHLGSSLKVTAACSGGSLFSVVGAVPSMLAVDSSGVLETSVTSWSWQCLCRWWKVCSENLRWVPLRPPRRREMWGLPLRMVMFLRTCSWVYTRLSSVWNTRIQRVISAQDLIKTLNQRKPAFKWFLV